MNVTTQAWLKRLPPWIYKLGAQAWIDYQYPRHIFLETTSSCNLTCSYCPREKRNDHMDFDLFTKIVDEASKYGPRSFSLHLFGEPLLYPNFRQAVDYIKEKNSKHTVLVTTNGTLLERKLELVTTSGIDLMLWSWRPEVKFTQETKEKLRRWGKFRVRFINEVTPLKAYEEWKDWTNVEGRLLHNYGGNIDLTKLTTVGSSVNVAEKWRRWPCYHLWLAPAVAWNGNVLICCADPHQKEVIGHFPENSVHEAWTGGRLADIRTGHLKGEYLGICKDCDVWKQYPSIHFKRGGRWVGRVS